MLVRYGIYKRYIYMLGVSFVSEYSLKSIEMNSVLTIVDSLLLVLLVLHVHPSQAQIKKIQFNNNNFYQVFQPQNISQQKQIPLLQRPIVHLATGVNGNIFNQRATILYKPQTPIILNDGQEKEGDCPVTRPASGYSSFRQVSV